MTRFLSLLVVVFLQGCVGDTTCDNDHESVLAAKSLSDDRLAALYRDSEVLLRLGTSVDLAPIPDEFQDLEPIYLRRIGEAALDIKLASCFDHGVFLRADAKSGQVTLRFGEGPTSGEEVLWTNKPT